jgi:hypothetical protein
LIKKTDAVLVVSSSWRLGTSIEELRATLESWGVVGTVIDKTPVLHDQNRGAEIAKWLADFDTYFESIDSFVILDDDSDMGELLPYLIKTNGRYGMNLDDANKAMRMLQGDEISSLCVR